MKLRKSNREEKIELQMTPMIDIVFQLLIFFIMTFKIVLPEGDFNIRMPLPSDQPTDAPPPDAPLLNLRIRANDDGSLAGVSLGDRSFGAGADAFAKLHQEIRKTVGDDAGPGGASEQEVEIDVDYNLAYAHTMRAITALSGYIENGQRHRLIEKLRFAKARSE